MLSHTLGLLRNLLRLLTAACSASWSHVLYKRFEEETTQCRSHLCLPFFFLGFCLVKYWLACKSASLFCFLRPLSFLRSCHLLCLWADFCLEQDVFSPGRWFRPQQPPEGTQQHRVVAQWASLLSRSSYSVSWTKEFLYAFRQEFFLSSRFFIFLCEIIGLQEAVGSQP